MPLISVILPTCDRPHLLPRAVASVRAQTEADFELLVIDNNRTTAALVGTDGAGPWSADPRVRLIRAAEAESAAAARNAGLAAARGEWVTYLDDDDAYRPEKLARQLELARHTGAALVLCGAEFHLHGRRRRVQCDVAEWAGDDLLLRARWNTPLLLHRHPGARRFDESLGAGEDAEFPQRLLAADGTMRVPVVAAAAVDIFPQSGPRVNANPAPVWRAAARILARRRGAYSRAARRCYVLQTLLAIAKLNRRPGRCLGLGGRLLWASQGRDARTVANALAVSLGFQPGRWVS